MDASNPAFVGAVGEVLEHGGEVAVVPVVERVACVPLARPSMRQVSESSRPEDLPPDHFPGLAQLGGGERPDPLPDPLHALHGGAGVEHVLGGGGETHGDVVAEGTGPADEEGGQETAPHGSQSAVISRYSKTCSGFRCGEEPSRAEPNDLMDTMTASLVVGPR